jgi:hypothetical protein
MSFEEQHRARTRSGDQTEACLGKPSLDFALGSNLAEAARAGSNQEALPQAVSASDEADTNKAAARFEHAGRLREGALCIVKTVETPVGEEQVDAGGGQRDIGRVCLDDFHIGQFSRRDSLSGAPDHRRGEVSRDVANRSVGAYRAERGSRSARAIDNRASVGYFGDCAHALVVALAVAPPRPSGRSGGTGEAAPCRRCRRRQKEMRRSHPAPSAGSLGSGR